MEHNRLNDLLAAYGSRMENWPEHDQILFSDRRTDFKLTDEFADAQHLDQQLDSFVVSSNPYLSGLILDKIKLRLIDQLYQWLLPDTWKLAWQPAMATLLVVLLGFSFGMQLEEPDGTENNWEDQLYWAGFASEDDFYE